MELCDTFSKYTETQKAAICLSLISAVVVVVTLVLRSINTIVLGKYHILIYVILLAANVLIISMFFNDDQWSKPKALKSYTDFQQEAIVLNVIVCILLVFLIMTKVFSRPARMSPVKTLMRQSPVEFLKAVSGVGHYEHSSTHTLLYAFILFSNLFSISFFTC
jgi:hypothetical protein